MLKGLRCSRKGWSPRGTPASKKSFWQRGKPRPPTSPFQRASADLEEIGLEVLPEEKQDVGGKNKLVRNIVP
jgi:hypothetical protein